jgi:hypothetical protein
MHPTISPLAGARVVQYLCNLPLVRVEPVAYTAQPLGFFLQQANWCISLHAGKEQRCVFFHSARCCTLGAPIAKSEREREHLQGLKAAAACHLGDTEKGQCGHVISSRARTPALPAASEITIIGGVTPVENAPAIKIRI